jgi:hypothetical protein
MRTIEYQYTREWNGSGVDYWPKVPASIVIGGISFDCDGGIIDSGAQDCLVNIELAKRLKVDLRSCASVPLGGASGEGAVGYLYQEAKLRITDFDFELTTPVIFAPFPAELILGQKGFFDHFQVLFEKNKGIFKLTTIPSLQ